MWKFISVLMLTFAGQAEALYPFSFWQSPFKPSAFSFTNQTNVATNSTVTSNSVTLSGTGARPVTATCTNCTVQRNGTGGFAASVSGFRNGDTLNIRVTSSSANATAVTASVQVGTTTSGTWSVTTAAPSVFTSCLDAQSAGNNSSGVYTIDPDGAGAIASFQVYCDMTTDGGGWTLVANGVGGSGANAAFDTVSGYNMGQASTGVQGATSFVLSKTIIDLLAVTKIRLKSRGTYTTTVYQAPGWGNLPCQSQVAGSTYTDLALTQNQGHRGHTCTSSCGGATVLGDPGWSNCCGNGTSRPGLTHGSAGNSGWSCGPSNGNASGTVGNNGCGNIAFGFPGWDTPYSGLGGTDANCSIEIWAK